jgi:hypothetical protein
MRRSVAILFPVFLFLAVWTSLVLGLIPELHLSPAALDAIVTVAYPLFRFPHCIQSVRRWLRLYGFFFFFFPPKFPCWFLLVRARQQPRLTRSDECVHVDAMVGVDSVWKLLANADRLAIVDVSRVPKGGGITSNRSSSLPPILYVDVLLQNKTPTGYQTQAMRDG